jgi:hypothetical protein
MRVRCWLLMFAEVSAVDEPDRAALSGALDCWAAVLAPVPLGACWA